MKPWPYPRLVAHRGGGTLAPENTLAAIRFGQSLGYAMHEIDVKLAKDAVPFLLHDATLERTTSGVGPSCERTWEELCAFDAGLWHSEAFRGERLASFDAAARLLQSKDTRINVEIKPSPGFESETGEKVARAAAELWKDAPGPPLLSSFSFDALMAARAAAPELPRGWLVSEVRDEDWARMEKLDAVSLHTNHRRLAHDTIEQAHGRGLRVLLYTVNEIDTAQRFFDAGVDSIVTDNLAEFAKAFPDLLTSPRPLPGQG
jgi:glycerophosphoryl diester phosphodiesterase